MDQQSIILYLARKGLAAVVIYEALVAMPRVGAISNPSATRYLREAKFTASNPEVTFSELIREHDDCDQAVLLVFDEQLLHQYTN
jgi:hypothetical protein